MLRAASEVAEAAAARGHVAVWGRAARTGRLGDELKREFPKSGGTLFWGPYNKDPTI